MSLKIHKKYLPAYFSLLVGTLIGWHSFADGAPRKDQARLYPPFALTVFQKPKLTSNLVDEIKGINSLERIVQGTLQNGSIENMAREVAQRYSEGHSILEEEIRIHKEYLHYREQSNVGRNFTKTIHREPYATLIKQALGTAKDKYNVIIPYSLFISLIHGESNWCPSAKSKAGAEGLGQFMPATSRSLGYPDPRSPRQLLGVGEFLARSYVRYEKNIPGFSQLHEEEKWNWVLLGYNIGPNRVPALIRATEAETVWNLTTKDLGREGYNFVPKIRGIERTYLRDYQNPRVSQLLFYTPSIL